jgi:peptide/nickel transport system ATP-binding protein
MSAVLSTVLPSPGPFSGPVSVDRLNALAQPLLSIRNLRVEFDDGLRHVPVVHGMDLDVHRGEALGIVGESGCGKSVTWLAVLGLLGPKARISGLIHLDQQPIHDLANDRLAPVRGKRIAMIFQDPTSSLNPVHRIGKQIMEALALRGQAARSETLRLLDQVHIPSSRLRMDAYPHELSGGMNQRVMIAMALAGEPDILVADEPTTALDVTIQAQILDLLREIRCYSGMAMVLISHDLGVIAEVCDRVMVMYAGRLVEQAPSVNLFNDPKHPYTRGLMSALPELSGPQRRLVAISGSVPEAGHLPSGCTFGPRCGLAQVRCHEVAPPTREVLPRHHVACLRSMPA